MSKDVAAQFEAWEAKAAKAGSGMTREQKTGATMMLMWLEGRESHAILIDPTAPETVAALAEALDDSWREFDMDADWDKAAAAILPAFVARRRGKP
jgi:hypothetical protein